MFYRIQPMRNEVLLRSLERVDKVGGIYLPDSTEDTRRQAVVVALGPQCSREIHRGDTVIMPTAKRGKITYDNTVYYLVPEEDIPAVVETEMGDQQ